MRLLGRVTVWALAFYVFVDLVYEYLPGAWQYDKVWHFAALYSYGLALLFLDYHTVTRLALLLISPVIFEVIQIWVPTHGFDWYDMAANYLGTLAAIITYLSCQALLTIFGFRYLKI